MPVTVTWLSRGPRPTSSRTSPCPIGPVPCAKARRLEQRDADELARPGDRVGQAGALGEEQAIALASVQPVPWVLVVSIRWPCQLVILSVFDQRVGERVAFLVPALDQHRAAMLPTSCSAPATGSSSLVRRVQLGQVGRGDGRDVHQLAEGGDGRLVGQRARRWSRPSPDRTRSARRRTARAGVGDRLGGEGAADHADLDRIDADVVGDRVDLGEDISAGTGWTALTPSVFCAVIAVIAVIAWPPSMVIVLMSAWMPAPPPESDPAMMRMRGSSWSSLQRLAANAHAAATASQMSSTSRSTMRRVVALGHDPDQRLGARLADHQPAVALKLGLGRGDRAP